MHGFITFAVMMIEEATTADIPALTALVNIAYRGPLSRKGWTTEADLFNGQRIDEAGLKGLVTAPGASMHVYKEGNEYLGCVYLREDERGLYLGMLTVYPLRQDAGIGKALLMYAEDYARKHRAKQVYMRVIDTRTELIDWYIRRGYVDSGERVPFTSTEDVPLKPVQFAILVKQIL